jgi:hypothetical protein
MRYSPITADLNKINIGSTTTTRSTTISWANKSTSFTVKTSEAHLWMNWITQNGLAWCTCNDEFWMYPLKFHYFLDHCSSSQHCSIDSPAWACIPCSSTTRVHMTISKVTFMMWDEDLQPLGFLLLLRLISDAYIGLCAWLLPCVWHVLNTSKGQHWQFWERRLV